MTTVWGNVDVPLATRNTLRKVLESCQTDLVKLEAHDHPPGEEVHPPGEGAR